MTLQDIEFNLVRHCNYSCRSCNHFSPIADRWFMDPAELRRDLGVLSKVAHWKFACCQGGEPLIHPRVAEFMEVVHESGIADQVGLLTNGSLLDRMPDSFWETAKRVNLELRCSVYAKLPESVLAIAAFKAKKYGIHFRSWKTDTFRPMLTKHADLGQATWEKCPWKRCWTLHCGYLYFCPQSAFMPGQFPEMFSERPTPYTDGYKVEELTPAILEAMLERHDALSSCEICVGHGAEPRPWGEAPRAREKWIQESSL